MISYQCLNSECKKVCVVPKMGAFKHPHTGQLGKEAGMNYPTCKVCPSCGKPVVIKD